MTYRNFELGFSHFESFWFILTHLNSFDLFRSILIHADPFCRWMQVEQSMKLETIRNV